jgi:hypothetical protein
MPYGSELKKQHIYDSKMMHIMGLHHDFEVKNTIPSKNLWCQDFADFIQAFSFCCKSVHYVSSELSDSGLRIRIGSGFSRVSGSGSGFGIRIRIQEGKNDPQK